MSQQLCISGMHRSGTSLVSSWLMQCGLIIDDGKVIGPKKFNIKGHFEDSEFVSLQSRSLHATCPESKGWKYLQGDYLAFNKHALRRSKQLIHARDTKYDLWGWKDPRSVIFLEQWKKLLPNLKVFLVWRPISAVISSLLARSKARPSNVHVKTTMLESIQMWMTYNRLICDFKEKYDHETILLPLEYILNNDQQIIKLIADKFDIQLTYSSIDNIYDKTLLRTKVSNIRYHPFALMSGSAVLTKKLKTLSDLK